MKQFSEIEKKESLDLFKLYDEGPAKPIQNKSPPDKKFKDFFGDLNLNGKDKTNVV